MSLSNQLLNQLSAQQYLLQQQLYPAHFGQGTLTPISNQRPGYNLSEEEVQNGYWQASEEIYNDPTRGGCPSVWRADAAASRAGEIAQREAKRHANAKRACASLVSGLVEAFKPPFPDEGVKVGEVVGYRAWRRESDGTLQPLGGGSQYGPWDRYGINKTANGVPHENDGVGFWCFKDKAWMYRELFDYRRLSLAGYPKFVFGKVKMWGRIVEHEHGYRGEYAKIIEIFGEENMGEYYSSAKTGITEISAPSSTPSYISKGWDDFLRMLFP